MTPKVKIQTFEEAKLSRKLSMAFYLASLIPMLIVISLLVNIVFPNLPKDSILLIKRILMFTIGLTWVGFLLIKKVIASVVNIVNEAKQIANGDFQKVIDSDRTDEIGELARSFNRITRDLEKKIEELEASKHLIQKLLKKVSFAMASYRGVDDLLDLVSENMVAALEAKKGLLMLINPDKKDILQIKTHFGLEMDNIDNFTVNIGEGVIGWVAKEGKVIRASGSPFPDDGEGKKDSAESDDEAQNFLCVPVVYKDKRIGVLTVIDKRSGGEFSQSDEVLLTNLASQIAIAIENYRLNEDIERTYIETITALAMAVEAKDPYSHGHSKRVGEYATKIAEKMDIDEDTMKILRDGSILHDVGKIGIKDSILLKQAKLNDEEFSIMSEHAVIGEAIIKPVHSLRKVGDMIRHHHEKWDGTGYPDGLKEEEIPLSARILAVADSYDAMTTDRPYRKALPMEVVKEELSKNSGTQFDSTVVEAFLSIIDNL